MGRGLTTNAVTATLAIGTRAHLPWLLDDAVFLRPHASITYQDHTEDLRMPCFGVLPSRVVVLLERKAKGITDELLLLQTGEVAMFATRTNYSIFAGKYTHFL